MQSSNSDRSMSKDPIVEATEIRAHQYQEPKTPAPYTYVAHNIKGWPQHPQSTHYTPEIEWALNFYDIFLVLAPAGLIIKAILCVVAAKNDYNNNNWGINIEYASMLSKKLLEVNKQMATIFTIFFLAIMGTLFRRLALWKAQRGAHLADLELLQASVSPTSTLRVMWSLRRFTLASFAVASAWIWYYVGSQAAVQEFRLRDTFDPQEHRIAILNADAPSPFEDGSWDDYTQIQKTDMTSMFHVYSQKSKGETSGAVSSDIAGDALPFVVTNDLMKNANKDGWVHTPHTSDWQITQSIGAHFYVNDLLDTTDAGFNGSWHAQQMIGSYQFNASYLYVQCSGLTLGTEKAPAGLTQYIQMAFNMTNTTTNPSDNTFRTFSFWNKYNSSHSFTSTCSISQLNEELSATCGPSSCKTNRIRSRPGSVNPSPRTLFDVPHQANTFFDTVLYACGKPLNGSDKSTFDGDNGLSILKGFLDKGNYMASDPATEELVSSYDSSLSRSLTKYFNTFHQASKHLKYEHGFDVQELASFDKNITIDTTDKAWDVLTMVGAEYEPNYAISTPWIIVDIISCSILFVAAIVAFWLRKHTEAPDIFGYISSMTRDNPMLDVPGGSALGGMERSRMMKHVKVKIGEISQGDGRYGRIGMTYVADHEYRAKDLEKGKLYS
ncbi:hypothetical protein H2198_004588 [Neophaeococcomyces mojaviensis]|uniref:Uncharacterized protein n=1 Tax=Neophaeococcomyces mojaviensis TaxID=3383035 RepID=A0ACC3A816_9EURO|nr:hypothetical protein H2198_004588 [Knufia sp. JES_112]